MRFYADLHVHSKYSRATSRDLDLEHLAHWAARKGIAVVATGDFTHPAWAAELKQKLVPAEPGLYRLAPDIETALMRTLPAACRTPVRFMLEVEISTIYKKGDKTRKVHHLIYAPDFAAVDRISARLARIGNIASDGRPILGLDSRDLLEIALDGGPGAYLVPAHIWTPWFAALGSQSGFDSIVECYGDLAPHIFAVETGLSSDPAMNWRLSFLDCYRLVSNSDAHSPGKLGREATAFDGDMDYFAIKRALETGAGYAGTVEFFPEEGKYHLDGHRKCAARLTPRETLANGGRCPVCGDPVTVGVLHRIEMLADRSEAEAVPPPTAGKAENLVPLPEVLAEINGTGAASKAVARNYDRLIATLGPELAILDAVPVEDISRATSSLLAEAITRLRAGQVIREAGYDGEYGIIRLFEERELRRLRAGGAVLFEETEKQPPRSSEEKDAPSAQTPSPKPKSDVSDFGHVIDSRTRVDPSSAWGEGRGEGVPKHSDGTGTPSPGKPQASLRLSDLSPPGRGEEESILSALDEDQRAAARIVDGPLMILAGPGSGKTRTLTFRFAHLVAERGVAPTSCLAVTFTRRAADEMRERLAQLVAAAAGDVAVHTFHSLGLAILRETPGAAGLPPGFRVAGEAERLALLTEALAVSEGKASRLLRAISKAKRTQAPPPAEIAAAMAAYRDALAARDTVDFDDLVALPVDMLTRDPALAARWRDRFRFVSIDEFQDVDEQQYRLVQLLAPPGSNLCVIGDPNQAIYGFRGADAACFTRFATDCPGAAVVRLQRNYRSTGTIVTASAQIIAAPDESALALVRDMRERIAIHAAATERAEAEFVVATIERLIGGSSFFAIDSGRVTGPAEHALGFADFAVLCRTDAQTAALGEALTRSGIPFKSGSHRRLADDPAVRALMAEIDADDTPLTDRLAAAAARLDQQAGADPAALRSALARLGALAAPCDGDRTRLADAVALATEADFLDPRAERVSLLTLHAAKGLEFAVVFVVGLEDGILPLRWGARDEAADAEERRLFYVGMTRAKDRLILSRAKQRLWRGKVRALEPSPFLGDIEAALVRHQQAQPGRRRPEDRQLTLF